MEKRNIIRALTWGLSFIVCAAMGIYGLILSNSNSGNIKESYNLEDITAYINDSIVVKNLSDDGIKIEATNSENEITIYYEFEDTNINYTYKLTNNNLSSNFENDDEIAKLVLKIVLTANAQTLNESYSDIVTNFPSLDLTSYSIGEGLSYTVLDKTYVIVNLNKSLIIKDPEYFTINDLSSKSTEIIDRNYNSQKNNLKIMVYGEDSSIITISEAPDLSYYSYNSIISVLNIIFGDNIPIINYFKTNYSSINIGNKTFNGFKIELYPTLNDNEKLNFNETDKIIRITINENQIEL